MEQRFIDTPLAIVYREGDTLTVKPCLDTEEKDKVWGVQLRCGVIVSTKHAAFITWDKTKILVEKLKMNGKQGKLPSKSSFKKARFPEKLLNFYKTIFALKENGVDVEIPAFWHGGYYLWLEDENSSPNYAERVSFIHHTYDIDQKPKIEGANFMRLGVVF